MASVLLAPQAPLSIARLLALPPALRRRLYTTATASSRSLEVYDVVCVGGGPAGLSLLSALHHQPATKHLKVALIDGQDVKTSKTPDSPALFSNRCSSLTPSSVRFLRRTKVWEHLNLPRTQSYHGMDVWDGVSGSSIQFDPSDSRNSSFMSNLSLLFPGSSPQMRRNTVADTGIIATMCENANLTSSLMKSLQSSDAQLEILDKTRVESIQLGPEPEGEEAVDFSQWPIVTLPNGRQLAARLLVGADGANSPVRQFAGIPSHGWDYGQHGIVATLELEREFGVDELRTAYQRFLPTGTIALLPLPGNKVSLVWSITAKYASAIKQLSPKSILILIKAGFSLMPIDIEYMINNPTINLEEELAWRLQNTDVTQTGLPRTFPSIVGVQEGSVASFPLRMRHCSTYTGHRVALIGDAAHTMHPLAGQGLNLGLGDAESLAGRVKYGVEHGMDIGSSWCLDDYNSERWAANNAMLGVVDKLQKLYSVSSGPAVWGRSLGLDVINKLGPVKGLLMGAAAGS